MEKPNECSTSLSVDFSKVWWNRAPPPRPPERSLEDKFLLSTKFHDSKIQMFFVVVVVVFYHPWKSQIAWHMGIVLVLSSIQTSAFPESPHYTRQWMCHRFPRLRFTREDPLWPLDQTWRLPKFPSTTGSQFFSQVGALLPMTKLYHFLCVFTNLPFKI